MNKIELIRARLASSCKIKDKTGNLIDIEIFSEKELNCYLELAEKTIYGLFDRDAEFTEDLVIQGAIVAALGKQALIESSRESSFVNDGVEYIPPPVSEMLYKQWKQEYNIYMRKIEMLWGTKNFKIGENVGSLAGMRF